MLRLTCFRQAALCGWCDAQEFDEAGSGGDQILEGVAVELSQKGIASFGEDVAERTGGLDGAACVLGAEAGDQGHIGLHAADDFAETYLGGRTGEPKTAVSAARGVDETLNSKLMGDFNEVVAGDSVAGGDFGDGCGLVAAHGEVDEQAEGIVGVDGKAHFEDR